MTTITSKNQSSGPISSKRIALVNTPSLLSGATSAIYRPIGLLLLSFILSACVKQPYSNIDNERLKYMLDQGVMIYDIRRAEEWQNTGIIEGSQLLTFVDAGGHVQTEFLTHFTRNVGRDDDVIVICHVGDRSNKLAQYLSQQMGYSKVHNVSEGIIRWIDEGRAVAKL